MYSFDAKLNFQHRNCLQCHTWSFQKSFKYANLMLKNKTKPKPFIIIIIISVENSGVQFPPPALLDE